jgi:hypothetical protein
MDEARHDFDDNKESRLLKHLVLEFPMGHILSSKEIFDEATEDEKLDLEIVPIGEIHHNLPTHTSYYACWKVARVDLKFSKRGRIDKKEKQSVAAALLAAMMNSDVNNGDMEEETQRS